MGDANQGNNLADWEERVESRMRGDAHVRFGGRSEEPGGPRGRYRAPLRPYYNLLEGTGLELLVVNARHITAVPGRKTDVEDAEWIADLLRHGLLRPSFIPDRPQRELQELVRYRRGLAEERARGANRLQKALEGANVKPASVISNVLGVSGRAMLRALAAGTTAPEELAKLAQPRLQASRDELEAALEGAVGPHQWLRLGAQLRHVAFPDRAIAELDREIEARPRPFEEQLARLDARPGVGRRVAQGPVAAVGTDMARFPTAGHLASWATLCPGLDESAGKRRAAGTGHGNAELRAVLTEAAWAASHTRTYPGARFHRLAARRGKKRAIVAVAHTTLVIACYLLRDGTTYQDLGANYFDECGKEATARRAIRRLERLGYKVTLDPIA